MRHAQKFNPIVMASFILCLALASSWYGAILYVRTYPSIIEYIEPMVWYDSQGHAIQTAKPGQGIVMRGEARRQPYSCWGSFSYGLRNETVSYQFPIVRSQELQNHVHTYSIKHFFMLPADFPKGRYRLFVTVYPTCDGVDIRPTTTNFDTYLDVNS